MKVLFQIHENEQLEYLPLELPAVPMEGNTILIPVGKLPPKWEVIIGQLVPKHFHKHLYTIAPLHPGTAFIEFDLTGIVRYLPAIDIDEYYPVVYVTPTAANAFD